MDLSFDYRKLFDLTGKVCIVTGGTGYIGSQFVNALLAHGATVVCADIRDVETRWDTDKPSCDKEYSGVRTFAICDVSSTESIKNCFAEVAAAHGGRVDVLVNCATYCEGHGAGSQIEFMTDEVFAYGVDGSVGTVFRCTREIIPYMKENGGSIINIASMYGVVTPDPRIYGDNPQKNPPNYGAGKAGVLQFTRHSGAHLANYGIRANAITPGPYPNPNNQDDAEFNKKLSGKTMMERFGHPSELAGACVLLASDASSFMTGANIIVDGGWTAW